MLPIFLHLLLLLHLLSPCSSRLLQVQFLTRHCDRTPLHPVPLSHNPVDWSSLLRLGSGKLTGLGEQECFQLGRTIRDRYVAEKSLNAISGLEKEFSTSTYHIVSSHVPRAQLSAMSAFQAIFPDGVPGVYPRVYQTGLPALPNGSTAIPVHSVEPGNDVIIRAYQECDQFEEDLHKLHLSESFLSWEKLHFHKFGLLLDKFGAESKEYTLQRIDEISTLVQFLGSHNLWINQSARPNESELNWLIARRNEYARLVCSAYSNLGIGMLFVNVRNRINEAVGNLTRTFRDGSFVPEFFRMVQYSGHDSTILAASSALARPFGSFILFNPPLVEFSAPRHGSGLFFELHLNESKSGVRPESFFVRLFLLTGYNGTFERLRLMNATDVAAYDVPVQVFLQSLAENSIAEDWCDKCQLKRPDAQVTVNECLVYRVKEQKSQNLAAEIVLFLLIAIVFLLVIFLVICYVIRIRKGIIRDQEAKKKFEYKNLDFLGDE